MSTAQKLEPESERLSPAAWRTIGVVVLAPFMTQMDSTIVNVSLSSIRQDLHSSISASQWIISAYLLALALMLPLNGWLVDRIGTRKLYLSCFSAFTLASFICGAARTMPELILARVVQGIAGGLLAPLTQLMMARIAGKQMAKVLGIAAAPILLAPLVGPILAGAILKYAHWPWLFYVNLPVGVLAVALAYAFVPHDESLIRRRPFDILGFLMISPGMVCLIYGFERASHHDGIGVLVLGVALVAMFAVYARRKTTDALIDIDLFREKTFSVATITQFLSNGILYAGQFLVPLYLITGCGLEPAKAGWLLAPMGLGMLCVYPFLGVLTDKLGCRATASGGVILNLLGTLPFLWMSRGHFSEPLSMIGIFVRGVGQGATGVPSLVAAYSSIAKERLGSAATALNIVQRLGGPAATTALAVVISVSGSGSYFIPFVALMVLQFVVLASAIQLPTTTARRAS
jgi:EmrB/QacA subfamily drug resistance transporter